MAAFFLWCILFVLCWPLALLALVLYPIVWLLLLPAVPHSGHCGSRSAGTGLGCSDAAGPSAKRALSPGVAWKKRGAAFGGAALPALQYKFPPKSVIPSGAE